MKILFIARTYPPLIGGMERFAEDFYNHFQKISEIKLLANLGGKKNIIPFFLKSLFFLIHNSKNYDVIHFSDVVLSSLIPVIRLFSNAKVTFTVHGLDIVYPYFGYQKFTPFFLKRADRIFAVSRYTMEQCIARGVPKEKLLVIPNGIKFDKIDIYSKPKKLSLLSKYNIPFEGKEILLSLGRLTMRKGNCWFLENVFNNLSDKYIYIIAGAGPEQGSIMKLLLELNLTDRVFMLGRVSEEEKNCLYQISDLFIMPNISVKNDQEGFGIVILEAGRYGIPVIASKIEGICDAVIDQKTGILVEEKDAEGFMKAIMKSNIDHSCLPDIVASYFDWKNIVKRYNKEFDKLVTS